MHGVCASEHSHYELTHLARTDKVKKKFPWYKRMNSLYRESPVVDRSAVANSTSQLDLTVLDRSQVCTIAHRQVHIDIVHRLLTMMGRRLRMTEYQLTGLHHQVGTLARVTSLQRTTTDQVSSSLLPHHHLASL
jgi:hypothetical protein